MDSWENITHQTDSYLQWISYCQLTDIKHHHYWNMVAFMQQIGLYAQLTRQVMLKKEGS